MNSSEIISIIWLKLSELNWLISDSCNKALTAGEMDYEQFGKELSPALDKNCYIQKPIENEILIEKLNRILSTK